MRYTPPLDARLNYAYVRIGFDLDDRAHKSAPVGAAGMTQRSFERHGDRRWLYCRAVMGFTEITLAQNDTTWRAPVQV